MRITRARHLDALRLADYKLKSLRQHFVASRRLLTDLRTLRRYLLDERMEERSQASLPRVQQTHSEACRVVAIKSAARPSSTAARGST